MSFFTVMMAKGYATLVAEDTEISVNDAAQAAREIHRLTRDGADATQRMAELQAKQNMIVSVFREFVAPERQQEMLARLAGRTTAPPSGGAQLALVKPVDDDEYDPLGDLEDDDDDLEDDDEGY